MSGLYKIRLHRERIQTELKLGKTKKAIWKEMKADGHFPYRYENFIRILKMEKMGVKDSKQVASITLKKKSDGAFTKPDLAKKEVKAEKVRSKYLS